MIRRTSIALAAVVAGFGLTACGSSSDDSSSDDGTLSRSELATKADAICKTGENDVKTVTAPANVADANDAAAYFGEIVPLHQKQTDALAALKPDADAKADWDAFMAAQNADQQLLDSILAKAKAKDASGQADLQKIAPQAQKFAAAARKLGAEQCAGSA
jgi:septal ring factor EnvC (AmiA/AmiB activator)